MSKNIFLRIISPLVHTIVGLFIFLAFVVGGFEHCFFGTNKVFDWAVDLVSSI